MANQRARNLRRNQTDTERKLWTYLRLMKHDGFHFRRQVPIDRVIVDFACYSSRRVVEVDGGQHNVDAGRAVDARRDAYLKAQGFRVLRFWNNEVLGNSEGVVQRIQSALRDPHPNPSPQGEGLKPHLRQLCAPLDVRCESYPPLDGEGRRAVRRAGVG
jgi:very-short-patch-repair endonuclease